MGQWIRRSSIAKLKSIHDRNASIKLRILTIAIWWIIAIISIKLISNFNPSE